MTFSLAHPHSHALWVTSSRSLLFTSPLVPFTVSLDVNSRIMHVNHLLPDSSAATAVFFPFLLLFTQGPHLLTLPASVLRSMLAEVRPWSHPPRSPAFGVSLPHSCGRVVVAAPSTACSFFLVRPCTLGAIKSPRFHFSLLTPSLERCGNVGASTTRRQLM